MEFCKELLIADYAILLALLGCMVWLAYEEKAIDGIATATISWMAQIAVSSGFYYWKAKAENTIKLPIYMLKNLPKDMKERADPNEIISTIMGMNSNH